MQLCLTKKPIMKKTIFLAVTVLAASASFAQKKIKQPPPPPPAMDVKEIPPPPPPPPPPKVELYEKFPSPGNADYQAFLKRNPTVKRIGWGNKNLVRIHLKSGKEEVYDMNKEDDVQKLKNKYGELPAPPPPPPPKVIKPKTEL